MSSPILLSDSEGSATEGEEDDDETIEILHTPPSARDQEIIHEVLDTPDRVRPPEAAAQDDQLPRPSNPVPPHSPIVRAAAIERANTNLLHSLLRSTPVIADDDPGGGIRIPSPTQGELRIPPPPERGRVVGLGVAGPSTGHSSGDGNAAGSLNTSRVDFKSPKKYKPKSPAKAAVPTAAASAASSSSAVADDEDAAECPICFEEWSNSGEHRLASLKCGHLFGKSCIEKWLREQKPGKCPQCKEKATKKDIRCLYAKALKMVDTTERDQALKDLEDERKARREAEMQAAQNRLRCQMAQQEVTRLRDELERARQQAINRQMGASSSNVMSSQVASGSQSVSQGNQASYVFDKTVKVWDAGNCRVMTYDPRLLTLVVSQPSASPLFPGFGIKKINALDFRTNQYVSIHQKMIRDVAFNPATNDGLLLSASIDKTIKVTSMSSSVVIQTYQCPLPVWSCVWNPDNTSLFYAGQVNGAVNVFDIRNTSGMVNQINTGQGSPVVSLQYIGQDPQSTFRPGGLLVGQLNKTVFFEHKNNDDYVPHALPIENQLTCLCLDNKSRHLLASYRPTTKSPSVRHMVYQLTAEGMAGTDYLCMANRIHTLHGGSTQKLLSRSKLILHPGDPNKLLVCAGDEASLNIHIWDTTTGNLCQKLPSQSEVLDFTPVSVNGVHYLAALTDKAVRLYKWTR